MVMPLLEIPTVAHCALPGGFLSNSYLFDLTRFRLSEIQWVKGELTTRPAAPLPYANGWGSLFVLSTPMAVAYLISGVGLRRLAGIGIAVAGIVVAIASVNRGVWLLLGIAGVIWAIRLATKKAQALLILPAAVLALLGLLTFTPLGDRVDERLEIAGESDRTRSGNVAESIEVAGESPIVGHGAPQEGRGRVPVGTHGLAWYLLVSHGFVGLALMVAWLLQVLVLGAGHSSPVASAARLTVLLTVLQLPIYGLLPHLPLLGAAAAVLSHQHDARTGIAR